MSDKTDPLNVGLEQSEKLLSAFSSNAIRASALITNTALQCTPQTLAVRAAQMMQAAGLGSIFVVEQGKLLGYWSSRHALHVEPGQPVQKQASVASLMSDNVPSVCEDAILPYVVTLFQESRACQLLVLDQDENIRGGISRFDFLLHPGLEPYLHTATLNTLAGSDVQLIAANMPLTEVRSRLYADPSDVLVVEYPDGQQGVITSLELLECFSDQSRAAQTAGQVACPLAVKVPLNENIWMVRNILATGKSRYVGVQDERGQLVNILTPNSMLEAVQSDYVGTLERYERKLTEIRKNMLLVQQIIDSSLEGIVITDLASRIVAVNPAFTEITGYTEGEVLGHAAAMLAAGQLHLTSFYRDVWTEVRRYGYWRGEVWSKHKSGKDFLQLLTITALKNERGQITCYAASFSDITRQKESEEKIRKLAYYDALTGLPNRRFIETQIAAEIEQAYTQQTQLAVLFIDLDNFKRINDSLGHRVGDLFLKKVAERLQGVLRSQDTIARMGGDEFIALLTGLAAPQEAIAVGRRMLDVMRTPIQHEDHQLMVGCTIGISICPLDGMCPDILIGRADTAMYRAKSAGRNGIRMYTDAMNRDSINQLNLESALFTALENQEFELYYQPIVCSRNGVVFACEALIRWNRKGLGVISPAQFLPLAEELNLMVDITDWVIETALIQLAQWHQAGHTHLKMSLNMSSKSFFADDFLEKLHWALLESEASPQAVILEITERMLMDDQAKTISQLEAVQTMGISLALDDFGTGWSSLTHLRNYPLDILKIDRDFVLNVQESASKEASIIAATIMLTQLLGLNVVAEGVECEMQVEALAEMGCNLIQGYYYSKPVTAADMEKLLLAGSFATYE